MIRIFVFLTIFLQFSCANWNSIDRESIFEFKNGAKGKAIHLDAKQRIVIQKEFGIVCAEPSPDALSAAAASGGFGVSDPSGVDASLSSALSETAASIGLRTQSIQLMRDALYRVCELYYGRALNDVQVMMLHQKYQDVMVALLAVEQLTGAVSPKAVGLGSNSKSDAIARSIDLGEAVRDSRSRIEAVDKKITEAEAEKIESKARLDAADARLKLVDANASTNVKADAQAKRDTASKAYDDKSASLNALEASKKDEQRRLDKYEKAEDSALTQVISQSSGSASLDGGFVLKNIDQQTAEKITIAVKDIVGRVVDKDYKEEACLGYLSDLEYDRFKNDQDKLNKSKSLESACLELLERTLVKNTMQPKP